MTQSKNTYKIGVISDTHDRWYPEIATLFADVDEIWHLGDVCKESILDHLRAVNTMLTVVLGNNDFMLDYPLTRELERNGEKFHLVHIPPVPEAYPNGVNWLLFGHTHRPCDEIDHGIHLFNPGAVGRTNKGSPPSVGMLTSSNGGAFEAKIIQLQPV